MFSKLTTELMKISSITFILAFFSELLFAQNQLVKHWDYRFGGLDYDGLTCFKQTNDKGYILGGYSYSGIGGDKTEDTKGTRDYWIVKVDSLGNKEWDKDFGGSDDDYLATLILTSDGGFLLGGSSNSGISGNKTQPTHGDHDYWIIKLDSLGNQQWDRDFGGNLSDGLGSICSTKDNGYILGGVSMSDSSGDKSAPSRGTADYWIVKIDSSGNKQWDLAFGGIGYDQLITLQPAFDGGYLLGGTSTSDTGIDKSEPSWGVDDYWIIKIDSAGIRQWDRDFGGTESDVLWSLQQTRDSGFILAGISGSDISGNKTTPLKQFPYSDYWIIKVDSLGNRHWEKDFGGNNIEDDFGNVALTSDGGYLFSGTSYSGIGGDKTENNMGDEQGWIIKSDSLGNIQWDKTLFTTGHDEISLAIPVDKSCFTFANASRGAIGGYKSQAAWNNSWDYWIVKFCDTSLSTGTKHSPSAKSAVTAYPNPFNSSISIKIQKPNLEHVSIIIENVFGQSLFSQRENSISLEYLTKINLTGIPNGIYAVIVNTDGERIVKHIIKE
jgi:hypothetical protein